MPARIFYKEKPYKARTSESDNTLTMHTIMIILYYGPRSKPAHDEHYCPARSAVLFSRRSPCMPESSCGSARRLCIQEANAGLLTSRLRILGASIASASRGNRQQMRAGEVLGDVAGGQAAHGHHIKLE
eukprot:4018783-Pleurochrysis_carterae.AAC.3